MSLSTPQAVRETFLLATRQSLARSLRTSEDWDRYKTIVQDTENRLEAEQAAYARDYPARIAEAKEILLREAHGIRLDRPLPPGVERRSDAETLQRHADARVRQDHDLRVSAIKSDELDQYRDLTAEIRTRDAPSQTRTAFNRARTRSGPTQT